MRCAPVGRLRNVLVLNIGGLGDMVMATPALAALARGVEGGRLDLVTVGRSAPVIEGAPFVRRCYIVDVSVLTGRPNPGGAIRLAASLVTLLCLRMNRYDLAVDLMATESPRAARRRRLLLGVICARRTAGRDTNGWAGYLDVKVREELESRVHEIDRKLAVVQALVPIDTVPAMQVFSTEGENEGAGRLYESVRKVGSRGVAILVPGAWRPTRRWDVDRFIAVGNHLMERHRLSMVVCGSSDERHIVQTVAAGLNGEASVLPDVSVGVLFGMIARCDIMVTNDTGPMHLAAAAEKPSIVAIFGPENPDRYAPKRDTGVVVLSDRVDCSPCTRYSCPDMRCLEGIDVPRVVEAVDDLMARRDRQATEKG
jgi:ADP-heptose:LPS heptosyltransferase